MSTSVGRAFAATGDPIRGEPAILNFTNSNLPPELLKQQAAHWIVNGQLLPDIQGLTQEEQIKFVDKVDQVCRDESFLNLPLRHLYKGVSGCRLPKRETRNCLWERVQRNRATSNLHRTFSRAQKSLKSYHSVCKIHGHLERRIPRR